MAESDSCSQLNMLNIPIQYINPPREGMKLLVLDLDYTLYDCKHGTGDPKNGLRPGVHLFLEHMLERTTFDENQLLIKYQIKPLQLIWNNTHFSKENTLHVDDLQRNFELNPNNLNHTRLPRIK
ncbi:hypothetical protein ROZALSC1DRAFT_28039 [Rozella allomycis CSF55]|uniref:FCP1 homology domain-containing protein n=1 Tax=Rozella allomycis (strain CSF55) TaxID=988480 RepID=A0A075ASD5_ROZAC|nr:hypothetical protein O9G_001132 [Rozella allomycis CSF55]RKP20471.1 hypothetical protein ROZALSC1DRAFT_28039 [Rozella allomycis CSF55]|eukprot:EPZ33163.1 hypothetical protein O9G_001132 [Rozella allomycis CSF55]